MKAGHTDSSLPGLLPCYWYVIEGDRTCLNVELCHRTAVRRGIKKAELKGNV